MGALAKGALPHGMSGRLPASMKLLGDLNWYLPSWLEWIPKLPMSEDVTPLPAEGTAPGGGR